MISTVVLLTIFLPHNIYSRRIEDYQPYFCPQGQELRYDRFAGRTKCTVVDPYTVPPWERPITAPPKLSDFTRATYPEDPQSILQNLCVDGENEDDCFKIQFDCQNGESWNIIRQVCEPSTTTTTTTPPSPTPATTERIPRVAPGDSFSKCRRGQVWSIILKKCVDLTLSDEDYDDYDDYGDREKRQVSEECVGGFWSPLQNRCIYPLPYVEKQRILET